jgi:DNA-binding phage protein
MTLTRDFKETVNARVQRDSAFAIALLDEAVSLFLNGEPETARLILRDLVNTTVGFEELAIETSKPSKSLHRMLSAKGNPTMDNLTIILNVLRKKLQVDIKVHVTARTIRKGSRRRLGRSVRKLLQRQS